MSYKKNFYFLLISVVVFFIFASTSSLGTHDIGADQAFIGNTALHLLNNIPSEGDITLLGRHIPLGLVEIRKHGALEPYLFLPFILLGGTSSKALRIASICFGALTIILSYWFASEFLNPSIGIITSTLLAINPAFIEIIEQGDTFSPSLFSLITLLFFLKYHRTKKNLYFFLGMFTLGVGFNTKVYFLWFIIAISLTGLFLYFRSSRIKLTTILLGLLFLFVGSIPVLYFYFKTDFLHRFILTNLHITSWGVNNLEFFKNLSLRLNHLNGIIMGKYGIHQKLPVLFFGISFIYLLLSILRKKQTILPRRKIFFTLSLVSIVFICSNFTISNLYILHLILLLPYIQIIIGITVWQIFKSNYGKLSRILISSALALLVYFSLTRCIFIYRQHQRYEYYNKYCNTSSLKNWLLENKLYKVVFFSYDVGSDGHVIRFLSNFKIDTAIYHLQDNLYLFDDIYNAIKKSPTDAVFVIVLPASNNIYNHFESVVEKLAKRNIVLKEFLHQDGTPKFIVCKVN